MRIELTEQGRRSVVTFLGVESEGFKELFQEIATLSDEKVEAIDWFLSRLERMFTIKLQ